MTVRRMTEVDLDQVLDWAAEEGWNPGLDDAAAFFASDPEGFFMKERKGVPVAAVSVVNHSPDFAFLGLYICRPEFRGQGCGMEVWSAGMDHAGNRCVGLDGVPDQQANYIRSGFSRHGGTTRYRGHLEQARDNLETGRVDIGEVIRADRLATGVARDRFAEAWFADTATRRTVFLPTGQPARNFATFRRCREGVKIGPFHAESPEMAGSLLARLPAEMPDGPVFVDVPDTSPDLSALLSARGFEPVFQTARMYSAKPPVSAPPRFHGVATLELG